ncbi:hypothetical protein [Treponema sp.]|uniref:hypothetical protein n=1 Tax=Treponema sp. TaxID=166 RepID=UPI00388D62D5
MNIIPSIFNEHKISYTVFGGTEDAPKITIPNVTCVVLSRNGRQYRQVVIEKLLGKGFAKIISVNQKSEQLAIEQLAHHFPTVEFIVALEDVPQGELLNIAFSEAKTEYVLVIQEEMCGENFIFNSSLAEKFIAMNQFCVAPRLVSDSGHRIPVVFRPDANRGKFKVDEETSVLDNQATLYCYDYAGFYNRETFCLLGGFDYTITSEYWQKLDFFMRAWLWGETISVSNVLELSYSESVPEEDRTVELSYLRFYLKNILPSFVSDHAKISRSSFFRFKIGSTCGFVESWVQFKDAIRWTADNQYRFKTDAVTLIENWSKV